MKFSARLLLILGLGILPFSAHAQMNYTQVSVYRIVKVRILPGKTTDFYKAFAYAPKIWEAEKAAGLLLDYKILHSVNYEGADKYDIEYILHFKNMAALDTVNEDVQPIVAKVYGTAENRAAMAKLQAESGETVSSELVREIALKPMP